VHVRLRFIALPSIHILIALNCFLIHPAPVQLIIGTLGLLCTTFYFIRFGRELSFLLKQSPPIWNLFVLQCILVTLSFFYPLSPSTALCWMGLLLAELIRLNQLRQYVQQQEGIESLTAEQHRYNEAFRRLRSERHDFLKHVNAVQHLLAEQQYDGAQFYFQELIGQYTASNSAIAGENGHIAVTLLHYQAQAEANGTDVLYELETPLSRLPMKITDQVKLLSNLLSNATEAASEYARTKKKSYLHVRTNMYGGIFILEVTNSTPALPKEIVDYLFQCFDISTKGGSHEGLGTYIIAKTTEQYGGTLRYTYEEPMFSIKIKVPIVVEKKHIGG